MSGWVVHLGRGRSREVIATLEVTLCGVRHRIRRESANEGITGPAIYAIICSCGKRLEGKTRADALTLMHAHRSADDPRRAIPPRRRLVTELPLDELWNDKGLVSTERLRELDADEVQEHLTEDAVAAIARAGAKLEWIDGAELSEWWDEQEAPERAWKASLWSRGWGSRILLFEQDR